MNFFSFALFVFFYLFFLTFQTNHSVLWGYIAKGGRGIFFLRCLLLNGVY